MINIITFELIKSSYATAAFTTGTIFVPREGMKPLTLTVASCVSNINALFPTTAESA